MAKCIYICSAGHSGSTLLDLLLGSHSNVTSLGEINQLSKNLSLNTLCTCGEEIRSCDFWKDIANQLKKNLGLDVFADPYSFILATIKLRLL